MSETEIFASSIFHCNIMHECCPRSTEKLDSHGDDFRKTYPYSAPRLCASCLSGFVGGGVGLTMCQQCSFSSNDGPDDDHNGSSVCTCRNCSFNATSDSLHAEEVPHASSSTWRRLFRGMKSSKLPRQVDSIRAESSSNGSWRFHRALPCEHFAFTCFSYLFYPPSCRHSCL